MRQTDRRTDGQEP